MPVRPNPSGSNAPQRRPVRLRGRRRLGRRRRQSGGHRVRRVPCALCRHVGRRGSRRHVRVDRFASAQRELIVAAIGGSLGVDPNRPFCVECLAALERMILARQIVSDDGRTFFVDRLLSPHPIMPLAMRLEAGEEPRGRGVTICFIDSGFVAHPDLVLPDDRIVAMYDANTGRRLSPSARQRGEPPISAWHGTMTAASATGSGHLSGGLYRGLASEARLVLVATMTPWGGIRTPQVVRALEWVLKMRERYEIRIVNVSLGIDETTDSLEHPVVDLVEKLVDLGVVVVAAAGNGPDEPIVPPAWSPSAITVGGIDDANSPEPWRWGIWWGSHGRSYDGAHKPEIVAPAIWLPAPILDQTPVRREADALFAMATADDHALMRMIPGLAHSTLVGPALVTVRSPRLARSIIHRRMHDEKLITACYKHVDGTSFAAPIVSAIVARMLEVNPALTPADVRAILLATAVRLPNVPVERQGAGVVRAAAAVEAAATARRMGPERD
ncbi:MAG TPA: S8 family serine peptidase [Candidatus Kapabacteria bacterium]|nr:S8 family serine peptidase [Candidatus Kapabacteria bacterium]